MLVLILYLAPILRLIDGIELRNESLTLIAIVNDFLVSELLGIVTD
jgi:hypothetical protein